MKKICLKVVIVLAILTCLAFPLSRLKADSGWDSDYDSGPDYSDSWDLDDSSRDSESSSRSENGEIHMPPIEIIIMGLIFPELHHFLRGVLQDVPLVSGFLQYLVIQLRHSNLPRFHVNN